jgi:aldose 1-epimerase
MKLIDETCFDITLDNRQVKLFTLKNENGVTCQITNFGGRIVTLFVPNKNGICEDVVLGYGTIQEYLKKDEMFFGAAIGRYGNRIANGKFKIQGKEYQLSKNNGNHNLHGGEKGFHNVVWSANQVNASTLELTYLSLDGEEGFPGNLQVKVMYTVSINNTLEIKYEAETDKSTIVNLTHHSYFNLCGIEKEASVENHLLTIKASNFTPTDSEGIPTGEIVPVTKTPFDFTLQKRIGENINDSNEQLSFGKGYDHNFVLDKNDSECVAKVHEPISGRTLEVFTNEPGIQFYSFNHIDGIHQGKNNTKFFKRTAFCLETQHFPNSPNQSNFPSTILHPDEKYTSYCYYKFGVKE